MSPVVDTKDLIGARGVAELLELSHPNSVFTYLRRYEDMPRPIVDLGGHLRLWLRPELERWWAARGAETRATDRGPARRAPSARRRGKGAARAC